MATEHALSAEGIEPQSATNLLRPFLLAYLIMGKVLSAGGESPRIVIIASDEHRLTAHDRARGDPEGWKGLDPKPLETGVSAHVYAALDLDLAGPWVDPVKPWATSALEAERLWKLSEELVGEKFTY
ncbi:hypothetical protein V6Z96_005476 [Aspergillus fumigatus]